MADDTTTDGPILPDEGAIAEPTSDDSAAATQPEPTSNDGDSTATPEPQADNSDTGEYASLKEWADKKGYDLSTEDGQARAWKSMREAEQRMHQSTKKASDLEKSLQQDLQTAADSGDEDLVKQLAAEVQSLKVTQSVNNFFSASDVPADKRASEAEARRALEPAMASIVTDNPTIGQLVKGGYLSYDQLYAMAKGSDSEREQQLRQDGGREALKQVADKQQAKAIPGAATTAALAGDNSSDPFLEAFDKET